MLALHPRGFKYIITSTLTENNNQAGRGDLVCHWEGTDVAVQEMFSNVRLEGVFILGELMRSRVGFDNIRRTRSCCACLGKSHSTITTAATAATPRALASRMIKTISQLGITHTEKRVSRFLHNTF